MKIIAVLLFTFTAAGCSQPPAMTNEQIIAATRQCTDAGMQPVPLTMIGDPRIVEIQCTPKPEAKE